ncbi:hypothetical protein F6476_11395 [Pseudomonas umsongensis]|nr:hypothetical protein F6476_11395 [Pseudomonas umsongensis]
MWGRHNPARPRRGLREQARSHRGFVNDTDQVWERACSRRGRHRQHTIRISPHEHHRKPQGLPARAPAGDPLAVRDHRAVK